MAGALVLLFFAPLLMSILEAKLFGTQYVDDAFGRVGLHEGLRGIYEPIVRLLGI